MKQITIAGRVGKTGELRRTQGGDPVLNFSVAVDDGYGENKSTMWFDCSVWGKRASALEQHITKGSAVTIAGDLGRREHESKTYLTVNVRELTLQGGGEKREAAPKSRDRDDDRTSYGTSARELDEESIPF